MKLLEAKRLKISFETHQGTLHAVRDFSFDLHEGECIGLVGESGCGKSVTALSLLGLLPNTARIEGQILWRGQDVSSWNKRQWQSFRGMDAAMIFQEPGRSFDPLTTVEANFRETILAHQPTLSKEEIRQRTLEMLHQVRIEEPEKRLKNFPHQFSGGMLQRLMIALALVNRPRLLIADEPTTALDVTIQAQIIQLLKNIKNELKLSIIFITHNLALLKDFAQRIIVLYNGLVMEEGDTDQILKSPRHPYTQLLMQSLIHRHDRHETKTFPETQGQPPDPLRLLPGCPFLPRCPLRQPECELQLPEFKNNLRCTVINGKDHA